MEQEVKLHIHRLNPDFIRLTIQTPTFIGVYRRRIPKLRKRLQKV